MRLPVRARHAGQLRVAASLSCPARRVLAQTSLMPEESGVRPPPSGSRWSPAVSALGQIATLRLSVRRGDAAKLHPSGLAGARDERSGARQAPQLHGSLRMPRRGSDNGRGGCRGPDPGPAWNSDGGRPSAPQGKSTRCSINCQSGRCPTRDRRREAELDPAWSRQRRACCQPSRCLPALSSPQAVGAGDGRYVASAPTRATGPPPLRRASHRLDRP
jgi:hypothetical protein